ncbi:solute carrier family 35 member F2 isoform X1 [Bombus vancouverensis nearcticus]|uniref:Solute carrier family 35 member F2-like isoform X3 n=2 Tax=Bombus impatiens TaxID=132113 RepID=A0A6P6F682_BOMIM|nr:solute carrier family 35 member F2-like isoform X3 [Bombus impatiens]XP_033191808.1 solute carrier family 35 member F2-like isoform X2 [Bombus vancouverensis nearcticus]
MHPGMGVSAGDRRYGENTVMQSRNGVCDKIENYISDLGQWSVWRAIILGQFLSLVLCFMTLANHHINTAYQLALPSGQNLPHYVMMCLVYTTWMSCRGVGNGLISVIRARGWRYLLLALIDVEACTLVTFSHQFTSLAGIQLLDCVAIPVALALSCLVLGVRYRMVHIVGVSVSLMGVGCLVWAGIDDNRDPATTGKNHLVGDMLCLGGAVFFSITTVLQELTVKTVDIIEYLGMIGFFGTILCGMQTATLESLKLESFQWNNVPVITFLIVYCITQFVFFSLVPVILFESGATALQLALLTADSFNVLSGMLVHQYKFHALYFVSYTLTMTGIYIYAIKRTPMSSNSRRQHTEPTAPDYRDVILRHMSHPDVGEVEMATSSGMSGVSGTLDVRTSTLGSEKETMDATSIPPSVSSDTAFTSFYGSYYD